MDIAIRDLNELYNQLVASNVRLTDLPKDKLHEFPGLTRDYYVAFMMQLETVIRARMGKKGGDPIGIISASSNSGKSSTMDFIADCLEATNSEKSKYQHLLEPRFDNFIAIRGQYKEVIMKDIIELYDSDWPCDRDIFSRKVDDLNQNSFVAALLFLKPFIGTIKSAARFLKATFCSYAQSVPNSAYLKVSLYDFVIDLVRGVLLLRLSEPNNPALCVFIMDEIDQLLLDSKRLEENDRRRDLYSSPSKSGVSINTTIFPEENVDGDMQQRLTFPFESKVCTTEIAGDSYEGVRLALKRFMCLTSEKLSVAFVVNCSVCFPRRDSNKILCIEQTASSRPVCFLSLPMLNTCTGSGCLPGRVLDIVQRTTLMDNVNADADANSNQFYFQVRQLLMIANTWSSAAHRKRLCLLLDDLKRCSDRTAFAELISSQLTLVQTVQVEELTKMLQVKDVLAVMCDRPVDLNLPRVREMLRRGVFHHMETYSDIQKANITVSMDVSLLRHFAFSNPQYAVLKELFKVIFVDDVFINSSPECLIASGQRFERVLWLYYQSCLQLALDSLAYSNNMQFHLGDLFPSTMTVSSTSTREYIDFPLDRNTIIHASQFDYKAVLNADTIFATPDSAKLTVATIPENHVILLKFAELQPGADFLLLYRKNGRFLMLFIEAKFRSNLANFIPKAVILSKLTTLQSEFKPLLEKFNEICQDRGEKAIIYLQFVSTVRCDTITWDTENAAQVAGIRLLSENISCRGFPFQLVVPQIPQSNCQHAAVVFQRLQGNRSRLERTIVARQNPPVTSVPQSSPSQSPTPKRMRREEI